MLQRSSYLLEVCSYEHLKCLLPKSEMRVVIKSNKTRLRKRETENPENNEAFCQKKSTIVCSIGQVLIFRVVI